MDFQQTWCVHWYCRDLVWDCHWANFLVFLTSYLPRTCPFFMDDSLSKCQWLFTKLAMCIDILQISFGMANGQISSIFEFVLVLHFMHIWLIIAISLQNQVSAPLWCRWPSWIDASLNLNSSSSSLIYGIVICPRYNMGRVLLFHIFVLYTF